MEKASGTRVVGAVEEEVMNSFYDVRAAMWAKGCDGSFDAAEDWLRGMCPVRSWMRRLDWLRRSWEMMVLPYSQVGQHLFQNSSYLNSRRKSNNG